MKVLLEVQKKSCYKEAYFYTLIREEDVRTLAKVQQEDLYEKAYLSLLKQERNE
jgi:hypothetical protein